MTRPILQARTTDKPSLIGTLPSESVPDLPPPTDRLQYSKLEGPGVTLAYMADDSKNVRPCIYIIYPNSDIQLRKSPLKLSSAPSSSSCSTTPQPNTPLSLASSTKTLPQSVQKLVHAPCLGLYSKIQTNTRTRAETRFLSVARRVLVLRKETVRNEG
jgi:hypothetical protein